MNRIFRNSPGNLFLYNKKNCKVPQKKSGMFLNLTTDNISLVGNRL